MQRIHAVFFHQGGPPLGEDALRTEQGLAKLRAAAAAHLSPTGQLQVATALDMLAAVEARMGPLRKQLWETARHLTGAKVLAARLYGVGPFTSLALTCWLGRAGRFSPRRIALLCTSAVGPGRLCSRAGVSVRPAGIGRASRRTAAAERISSQRRVAWQRMWC